MQHARIDGVVVSTVCHPSMRGCRTVIAQPLDPAGADQGPPVLALDPLGAGLHQHVIVLGDGSAVADLVGTRQTPLRNIVTAVLDEAEKAEGLKS
jgi:ethanolamine utilization protein EutN